MDLSGYSLEKLRDDPLTTLFRACKAGEPAGSLMVMPASRSNDAAVNARFEHELALSDVLQPDWAYVPLSLRRHNDRTVLLFEDLGGKPLDQLAGGAMELQPFLELAIGISAAVGQMHAAGIVHRDLKPANLFRDSSGQVRIFGFGFASRLPRERQAPIAPEAIACTLAYVSPEQTGRINRSIDSRSDLYSLGVTLYELLVGALPFTATDPTEWVYCHVARLPPPPTLRLEGIPLTIERIILKLLEKNAEDRYQTAAGLEYDLRRCHAAVIERNRIEAFALGERDRPGRLQVPATLYGRSDEIAVLLAAFHDVADRGAFRLVLVSGHSGAGKSSIVNELSAPVHAAHGLFACGKFDQNKRDIPYQTLGSAIQSLVRELLTRDEAELERWRAALLGAVGSCGQLVVDLVPELELILGPQAPPPHLAAEDEKNRFFLILRNVICVFAQPQHPLVLFLDDLQWIDPATLALLERLAGDDIVPHLLLVGAFRSNEVTPWQGPGQTLARIGASVGEIPEVRLAPLAIADITQLVADTLRTTTERAAPLGAVVFGRSQGNPYFAIEFLTTLQTEGLIRYDQAAGDWRWSTEQIDAVASACSIADLIAGRLLRYPWPALTAIRTLACLGNSARTATLATVLDANEAEVDERLRVFVGDDLLHRTGQSYQFSHDGVQEAAYDLVPEAERAATHLRIGRMLAAAAEPRDLEDEIFEVVNHYNRGLLLVETRAEKDHLAQLNLLAGKRAKAATAYESALEYFATGCALLEPNSWASHYRLAFDLEFHQADCKFLVGDITFAETRLVALSQRVRGDADSVLIVGRQVMLYTYVGRIDRALDLSVSCLAQLGIELPTNPGKQDIEAEYHAIIARIGCRQVADLYDLPLISEPKWRDVMGLLCALLGPAGVLNGDLLDLVLLRIINISLDHGHSADSCHAYVNSGSRIFGWRLGSFQMARDFGDLAMRLMEERGLDRYAARVYAILSGSLGPWNIALRDCYHIALRAVEMPQERGGITYSGYAWVCGLTALLDSGKPLADVERLAGTALVFAERSKFALVIAFIETQLLYIRALRGTNDGIGLLATSAAEEDAIEARLAAAPHFLHALTRFRVRKLQQRYLAGAYDDCLQICAVVGGGVGASPVLDQSPVFEIVEYCFFAALARAAVLSRTADGLHEAQFAELRHGHSVLSEWAKRCPQNMLCRATLVGAEIARLEGRELEAHYLYEDAVRFAREQDFIQVEAIANELASRFHADRGFETIAEAYYRNARSCYARWGADAKVHALDAARPDLADPRSEAAGGSPWRNVDIGAVVAMHQAVSQEIVLDQVIERLMATVVAHAGAVRGLLLLSRNGDVSIAAEALPDLNGITIDLGGRAPTAEDLPRSVLNYVLRSHEAVMLDDAMQAGPYAHDPYVARVGARSLLCLPLVKQAKLVGVLYLENNLSTHVFTSDRLAVLQLIASQAAISIENAALFLDLQRTQDHARRTRDELRSSFDMIPALAWRASPDGAVEFANKQWHDYTGVSSKEAPRGTWMRAIHPEDLEKVNDKWRHLRAFRTSGEFEARMRRSDGVYRRFLVRSTPMRDDHGDIVNWHGTCTDIEDLKRAEQAQEALARVSRVTALGELTVSIAHEINQPLMAIVTNAAACCRWLSGDPANIAEARMAAERIIRDGHRAGDVVAGIRALAKKSAPEPAAFPINDAIQEVLVLTRNELDGKAIAAETDLPSLDRMALGDRVQIQQVILNLILNGIEAMSVTQLQPPVLRISARVVDEDWLQIDVADTGIGLDPNISNQIFEVFVTTKSDGIGIGLSICRSIVEAHRGRLWVSSNVPSGTVFHFTVPLAPDSADR